MTNKQFEVKEYLSQAYYSEIKIDAYLNELERIRAKMTRTASLVIVGKNDGMKKNKTEELIYKYYDYIQKLEKTIDEQNDKLIKINDVIAKVENEKYNSILFLRYIQHKKWEDIAKMLQYDNRYLMKLHIGALNEIIKLKLI